MKIVIHRNSKVKDVNAPFSRAVQKLNDALSDLDMVTFKEKPSSAQTYTSEEKQKAVEAARLILQAQRLLK